MSDCKGCGKCQGGTGNQEHPDEDKKGDCNCGSNPQPNTQVAEEPKRVHLYKAKALMDG